MSYSSLEALKSKIGVIRIRGLGFERASGDTTNRQDTKNGTEGESKSHEIQTPLAIAFLLHTWTKRKLKFP